MNLSTHFTLEEMTFSSTAQRLGLDNTPSADAVAHLTVTAQGLEQVRELLGAPLIIDSGYRSLALNASVGGATNSAHLTGYAADFLCSSFGDPLSIVHAIAAAGIAFDQLIQEGTWVHISFAPLLRGQLLTANFGPNGTTYTQGIGSPQGEAA